MRPTTIWPFPDKALEEILRKVKTMIVAEISQGQLLGEIQRLNQTHTKVVPVQRYDGEMLTPNEVLNAIVEVTK